MTFSVSEYIAGQSGRHMNKINICYKANMSFITAREKKTPPNAIIHPLLD